MKITFSFGRNWKNYVNNVVNEKVLEEAKLSLLKYNVDFKNKVFIDIGCGSGLFSLSALLLGCKEVISLDLDEHSLEATNVLKEKFSHMIPANSKWTIFRGNILDENLLKELDGKGDIVYSWGVLHHTGDMWKAIKNATKIVKSGGDFIIAIYNHAPTSEYWKKVKEVYNNHPLLQPVLIGIYGGYIVTGYCLVHRTFNLYKERGMHVFYDVIDWIGGYPYEYACFDEIKDFIEKHGFELTSAPTKLPCGKNQKATILRRIKEPHAGCNEFVFKRR